MHGFWLFLHIFGFVLWLGGGLSSMVGSIATKHHTPAERLAVFTAFGAVARLLIAPGALLVVVTGIGMMLGMGDQTTPPMWLALMMGAGLLGALISIVIVTPTAAKIARLVPDPRGEMPEAFAGLRKRQVIGAMTAGTLGLIALIAGTVLR
jgi:hypothetical protein